ncbi:MAG: GAF domain-containing sensor histidine kinase, partial [Bacillota bacterium]
AAVPLVAEGQILGVVVMASRAAGQFALHQMEMLDAVGAHLALTVRNAQLYHRLREAAVVEERYRLSREMHDTLGQTLGYLGMQAERIRRLLDDGRHAQAREELAGMAGAIQEAYLDVREAIDNLRLTADSPGGLAGALQQMVRDFSARSGIPAVARIEPPSGPCPAEVQLHLLRMAQEALANVRKHSGATRVEVELSTAGGHLELSVADNGRGFDPGATSNGRHHGLVAMRERARAIGAQLTIATGPGQGTRILVRVPLVEGRLAHDDRARAHNG